MKINMNRKLFELDTVATGHMIKDLMVKKNVAIKDVSRAMNVSFQAVYRWQKGETLPTIENLVALACILSVPIDEIVAAECRKS